jgi:hypothetical protein
MWLDVNMRLQFLEAAIQFRFFDNAGGGIHERLEVAREWIGGGICTPGQPGLPRTGLHGPEIAVRHGGRRGAGAEV